MLLVIGISRSADVQAFPEGILPQYLAVSVNHQSLPGFIEIWQDGNDFWLTSDDARKLQIDVSRFPKKDNFICLSISDGLRLEYDALSQTLEIMVSGNNLKGKTELEGRAQTPLLNNMLTPSVNGLILNYSLFGQRGSGYEALSAYSELRSTGSEYGIFSSSFNSVLQKSDGSSAGETQRLNTNWTYSNPEYRLSIITGDSNTSGLSWSRSVRFGGITITRDYTLQPSMNTEAKSVLTDSVALPSSVDLYVNGVKSSTQKVPPGQFSLSTSPTFTGGGSAEVIITDINGRKRTVSLDIYGTQNMLAAGYNTWSANMGWLRKKYAENSFDYTAPVFSSAFRYGVTNSLTLEAHTEVSHERLLLNGIGMSWLTSPLTGIISFNAAESQYQGKSGRQYGIGWQWRRGSVGLSLTHQKYSHNYCDLACSLGSEHQKFSNSAWLTLGNKVAGNFGVGIVEQQSSSGGDSRYGSLSWTKTIGDGITLSVSASEMKSSDERQKLFYTGLSIPFGSRYRASLQASKQDDAIDTQWQFTSQNSHLTPDWGWTISGQQGRERRFHIEIDRTAVTHEWQAGTDFQESNNSSYVSLDGSLGWLDGHIYAMRNVPDAFAVIDTSGVPDVPVLVHNNPVGRTNKKGLLLVSDLNGWIENRIAINPLSLPGDYRAPETEMNVVPRAGNGVRVHFDVYRTHAILLTLRNESGDYIDVGSPVSVVNSDNQQVVPSYANIMVGYSGEVYLENPPSGGVVKVLTSTGRCEAKLPAVSGNAEFIEKAEIICH
ncbi:fimbria/pilus outer membrane usher protein [Citrobacter koseri]|uniref:fimbria/pilus outer membrane usher protein n=1 Tax=Citrobacter koseri TaxID=545 RepID=UPI00389177E1